MNVAFTSVFAPFTEIDPKEYKRATERSPGEQHYHLAFGRFYLAWASSQKGAAGDPGAAPGTTFKEK